MKKKWIAGIVAYIALIAVCIVVIYVVPSLKGMLEQTYVTEYGKIDISDKVSAYIVRDETVYVAAQDSEIRRIAETDKLLKARTQVVELTPIIDEEALAASEAGPDADADAAQAAAEANGEAPDDISRKYQKIIEALDGQSASTQTGYSKEAGYISYYIDGAEALLSTDRLDELNQSDYEKLTDMRSVETPSKKCGKGEPVFKVVHNSKWYLVFYIDNAAGEKYYEGRTVSVELAERKIPVRVEGVEVGKSKTKVTLSCKTFFEGFFSERTLKTTVTVASAEGLVIQDSSLVMKGEQQGVLVKNKLGEHKFKPVSIKADDGERCVVYSDIYVDEGGNYVETVKTYDEIVTSPGEEEIAELQEQAAKEAAEKAEKEAAEKAAKEAAEKAAAEKEAIEKQRAKAAKAAAKKAKKAESEAESEKEGSEGKEDKSGSDKAESEEKKTGEEGESEQSSGSDTDNQSTEDKTDKEANSSEKADKE